MSTQTVTLENVEQDKIKTKILHILSIYPKISPTMMQTALGPSVKPRVWKPALKSLIAANEIMQIEHESTTPTGRDHTYVILSLND